MYFVTYLFSEKVGLINTLRGTEKKQIIIIFSSSCSDIYKQHSIILMFYRPLFSRSLTSYYESTYVNNYLLFRVLNGLRYVNQIIFCVLVRSFCAIFVKTIYLFCFINQPKPQQWVEKMWIIESLNEFYSKFIANRLLTIMVLKTG